MGFYLTLGPSPEGEGGLALNNNLAFVITYGLLNQFSARVDS